MSDSTPHFEGNVDTRWLVHGGADREMKLLSAFAFVDSAGYRWAAHPGEKVDGASIPEQVWSTVVGTPFIGDYRRASVVHDVVCERHERTSRDAHRMFYEAMLADGTREGTGALVLHGGKAVRPAMGSARRLSADAGPSSPGY